ncbi:MAG TPA: hypothetical protein VLE49_21125 [Anaerolineales bacterium]|nr:hypothetical protein [Anaerolineales bacterium]
MKSRSYALWLYILVGGGALSLLYIAVLHPTSYSASQAGKSNNVTFYSSSQTDKNITFTISNVTMAKLTPQSGLLTFDICVDNPSHNYHLYSEGKIIVAGGFERDISFTFGTTLDPACENESLYIFPDETAPVEINISLIRPADEAEITGSWEFHLNQADIQDHSVLALLGPEAPIDTPDVELQALNLRKFVPPEFALDPDMSALQIDLCLVSPVRSNWGVWDAVLEFDNGENVRSFFYFGKDTFFGDKDKMGENCKTVGFQIPENRSYSEAHLKVFGLVFPPDISDEEKCNEYLYQLQKAIDDKYPGLYLKCEKFVSESVTWGIIYISKPSWMSDLDAWGLSTSQELYTVKGNWKFDLMMDQ